MLQLKNQSPFASSIAVFPDAAGIDTLYVVVKASFTLGTSLSLAVPANPVTLVDEYFGDPATSSLKAASELHLTKPSTDFVLMGSAHAPGGKAVDAMQVSLSVAERRKIVRVSGDRVWQTSGFSRPEPFVSMPLVFERAFGGTHQAAEHGPILAEERNPVGTGFRGQRSASEMVGLSLPNLEDPEHPIRSINDVSAPACFGFVAPSWLPRRAHAGTYDERWQKTQNPYLPADFNARFFNVASPELTFDRYLRGGERVELIGAQRAGALCFALPACTPRVAIKVAGSCERPPVNLELVLLEPDAGRVHLVFRAALACDKKVLKVQEVNVDVDASSLPPPSSV